MSLVVKIEGVDINTGSDLDRNVKESANLNFDNEKNRSASVAVWLQAKDNHPTEGQDLEVFDDATLLFGGVISDTPYEGWTPETGLDAWIKLQLTSDGFNSIPGRRTVDLRFENTDAGTIVNSMITLFLADEGITAGTIQTGASIDLYEAEGESVQEVLDNMADNSGFIWNINNQKQLDFLELITPTITTDTINEGQKNHFDFKPTRSKGLFRNKQFVYGGLDSTGATVKAVVQDSADIAARAASEGNSGVYGKVFRDNNIQTIADATAVATELLNRYKIPSKATFKSYEDFTEGTIIKVTYPKYKIPTDTNYLITKKGMQRSGHKWLYTYSIEARDTSNYTAKTKDNAIDFFRRLADPGKIIKGIPGSSVDIFVQTTEPTGAPLNSIWINPEDYSLYDFKTLTTNTTLIPDDIAVYLCTSAIDVTLFSAASGNDGIVRIIKNNSSGFVTVTADGTETIDGVNSISFAANEFIGIISDGFNWSIIHESGQTTPPSNPSTITIESSKIGSDLTDYPVMVRLTSSNFDFSEITAATEIYFTDNSDVDLKFEREYYSAVDEVAIFHVKIPLVSSTADTTFKIKYDAVSDKQDVNNTWNSGYALVCHMGSSLNDSTSNGNNGTESGTTLVTGYNGQGREFDSDSDNVEFGNAASLKPSNFTLQIMQKRDTHGTDLEGGIAYGDLYGGAATYAYEIGNRATSFDVDISNGSTASNANASIPDDNDFHLCAGSYDSANVKAKTDDGSVTSTAETFTIAYPGSFDYLRLGGRRTNNFGLRGVIDEVRLSNVARSEDWLAADAYNLKLRNLITFS